MTQQIINIGSAPNDGTGDNLRSGMTKVNANFTDLYTNKLGFTGNSVIVGGNVDISVVGSGIKVAEGSNAKQGVATLSSGVIVVPNTSVTATSRIFLTAQDNNSTGVLRISSRTPGVSFTITSSNSGDSGVIAYEIFEQG
jgi:hypothetical protein